MTEHHALFDVARDQILEAAHAYARTQGVDPEQHLWSVRQLFDREALKALDREHEAEQIARFAAAGAPIVRWRLSYFRPLDLAASYQTLQVTVDRAGRVVGVGRREYRPTALRAPLPEGWSEEARRHLAQALRVERSQLRPLDRSTLLGTAWAKYDHLWVLEDVQLGDYSVIVGARSRSGAMEFTTGVLRLDHPGAGTDWGIAQWLVVMVAVVVALMFGMAWSRSTADPMSLADPVIRAGYGLAIVLPLAQLVLMATSSRSGQSLAYGAFVAVALLLGVLALQFSRRVRKAPLDPPSTALALGLIASAVLAFFLACISCGGSLARGCCEACGLLRCAVAPLVLVALLLAHRRARFSAYALILAAVMLVPHCTCDNFINHYWIASIGGSPLCFLLFYATVLVAVTGLRGVHPRLALVCSVSGVLVVSAAGLGHRLLGFPW